VGETQWARSKKVHTQLDINQQRKKLQMMKRKTAEARQQAFKRAKMRADEAMITSLTPWIQTNPNRTTSFAAVVALASAGDPFSLNKASLHLVREDSTDSSREATMTKSEESNENQRERNRRMVGLIPIPAAATTTAMATATAAASADLGINSAASFTDPSVNVVARQQQHQSLAAAVATVAPILLTPGDSDSNRSPLPGAVAVSRPVDLQE